MTWGLADSRGNSFFLYFFKGVTEIARSGQSVRELSGLYKVLLARELNLWMIVSCKDNGGAIGAFYFNMGAWLCRIVKGDVESPGASRIVDQKL